MPSNQLPYPLFDADNHLCETREALTKFLPEKYAGAIQYVEVNGRIQDCGPWARSVNTSRT